MRVLMLTCNTGEGHNSAARAIKEHFDNAGIYCEMADSLAFLSQKASTFICKWNIRLYKRAPLLFGFGYKTAEKTDIKHKKSMIYEIVSKGARKLINKIESGNFDTVICTHPFAAMTLTRAIVKYKLSIKKSYFIATDYTCSPGVSTSKLDYYVIAHESLVDEFVEHNIPEGKIFPAGIPVSSKVHTPLSAEECKRELAIAKDKRVILLMCGSIGCGPMKVIARKLSELLKENELLVVICGTNYTLYKKLKELENPRSVRVLGYTNKIPLYLNCASLMLTKPGGLSSTEAASSHLPMILIDAVAGVETHNMNFWVNNNMAKTSEKAEDIISLARSLLDNEDELLKMRKKLEENFKESSSEKIFRFILENDK